MQRCLSFINGIRLFIIATLIEKKIAFNIYFCDINERKNKMAMNKHCRHSQNEYNIVY